MKVYSAVLLAAVCFLSGCFASARLYPIKGPLAEQAPQPIYAARAEAGFRSGSFSATLGNGEKCNGQWKRVTRTPRETGIGPADAESLAPAWDAVYGSGFYTANVLGADVRIAGQIPCSRGSSLRVDAIQHSIGSGTDAALVIKGVAMDGKGNIYKMAF